ncbi:hypothetical protein SAMN03080617_00002 [Algoriphagus alkaliphilus]|uniref:Uncharacterized protein n=1 Tax=Algoriphagus alkaliphilus TaxID=279824 RepID=A0A1G5UU15_9BACT|nr:hypothetical protein [Algoriphagus alkaliphilus]SDA37111.1 hypothetical protein SAMN03080617_00002 [Algoriphagus alkaliphilus]
MDKEKILKEIQNRLPDDIRIINQTPFELTEDEFLVILSWLKYFNWHYQLHKKSGSPEIQSPIISKRIRLDFYFYWISENIQNKDTGFSIYIVSNYKKTLKEIINTYKL